MKVLLTGSAGFIGYHVTKSLLDRGDEVFGIDSLNNYYDINLKYGRLNELGLLPDQIEESAFIQSSKYPLFSFNKVNIKNKEDIENIFKTNSFDAVCNLAAQAGVRYSLEEPMTYIDSNITGFLNVLENCRNYNVKNLSFASSSSVYGLNGSYPFNVADNADHPISIYAATKRSNELMAHSYSHLFGINITGLRFFTVYGPWGRPDMALFKFTKAAFDGSSIEVYNNGDMMRDFTYIDDITKGVLSVIDKPASPDEKWSAENPKPSSSSAPFRIHNIGNNSPVKLIDFIHAIELATGREINKNFLPIQPGDVEKTYADVDTLKREFEYKPSTSVEHGIHKFIEWYKDFYKVH